MDLNAIARVQSGYHHADGVWIPNVGFCREWHWLVNRKLWPCVTVRLEGDQVSDGLAFHCMST